ncbi:MAG: tail fiber domain-containing protein [Saprospiraceae bacterium]|nr:tail fiber domain-containing protein [Saprospiraceae bacterium]
MRVLDENGELLTGYFNFTLSDPEYIFTDSPLLEEGQVYTIEFTFYQPDPNVPIQRIIRYDSNDPYKDGSSSLGDEIDLTFEVKFQDGSINSPATALAVVDGAVGIGTNTPSSMLDIDGDVEISGSRLHVNSSGNVGIGTNTPSSKLDIDGDVEISGSRLHVNSSGYVGIGTNTPSSKLDIDGDIEISGSRLHVNSSGYVGIGLNNPTDLLDINGTTRIRSLPYNATLNNVVVTDDNGKLHARSVSSMNLWSQNGNNIYRNSGNVGIGTSAPGDRLSVVGNIGASGNITTGGNITAQGDMVVNGYDIWNVSNIHYHEFPSTAYFSLGYDSNNGGGVAVLPHATNWGSLGISGEYWDDGYISEIYRDSECSLSDSRVKQNVKNVSGALEQVKKLRGVTYDINTDVHPFYKDAKRDELEFAKGQMGFIAQELKEVFPEMVVLNEETGFYMVRNYEQLFPVVVEAIKEQQQQIEDLEAQVAEKTDVEIELQALRDHNARQDALIAELLQAMQKKDAQMDAMMDRMDQFDRDLQHCCLAHSGGDQTGMPTGNDQPHLAQNVPNPYSQETIIKYYLPKSSKNARIRVTDMTGRLMLSYDLLETGYGEIKVEAFSLLARTYVYELIIDDQRIDTKKMVVQN